tara:strand:- start:17 stop:139 length:123 start_codon:yes stop_codon:yes gene_type:complete
LLSLAAATVVHLILAVPAAAMEEFNFAIVFRPEHRTVSLI